MKRAALLCLAALALSFGQSRTRLTEYALILSDAPVAQNARLRTELRGATVQVALARIRQAQSGIVAELARRNVPVTGAAQLLVNAVFVNATPESAAGLRNIPGVAHVVHVPRVKPALTTALDLQNVPAAWTALSGDSKAGAGIKIGIIDSGIDQNHPGFQDSSLSPPSGFPKGNAAYTNNKVIVARSYIDLNIQADSFHIADENSPRDRIGHGTAMAMIATGVRHTSPQGAIEGVAPKAFLGNYKVIGSPGVQDGASFLAINQALQDAIADGMDVVTFGFEGLSAEYGPLDIDQANCGGACDVYAQAVEQTVKQGVVVVASAGNDGNIGLQPVTLGSIHTPGDAPSAITVGASTNAHIFYSAVHVNGSGVPSGLQNIRAVVGNGPPIRGALTARVVDAGLACSGLPAGSAAGAIALIQRGTCLLDTKINYAQSAGAVGVILYQTAGVSTLMDASFGAYTGIPAVLIGNDDATALKSYVAANASATASLDPALSPVSSPAYTVAGYSSRGPTPGLFGITPTPVLKPELVAVGDNVYTATQKFDPGGWQYNSTGYTSVSGTSSAVPMVAGAVALVKQKYPGFTPAQLKSAVVNTATQNVSDSTGQSRVNSVGAGQLSAADAVNVPATLDPATLSFGVVNPAQSASISLTLKITNVGKSTATFNFTDSNSSLQLRPSSLTLDPNQQNSITVTLGGRQTTPGSYEGSIVVTMASAPSGTPTLRVPYQYLIASGVVNDLFTIVNGSFTAPPSDTGWWLAFRAVDTAGVPVSTPVRFNVVSGGGNIVQADSQTDRLGNAWMKIAVGPSLGDQVFSATAGGQTVNFLGFARPLPVVAANGVVNAASNLPGSGLAPGSYIAIYGSSLADATLVESTASLPVSLAGVTVGFTGGGLTLPGHLYFVSPSQIDVQIPWEFQGQSSVQMTVMADYLPSATYTVPLATYSPAIFVANGNAAVLDFPGYNLVTASNPAKRGQIIQIFVNGLGPVDSAQVSGDPASTTQLANTKATPTVTIGGVSAPVAFSGLAPGNVGLYQVNVTVPANAPTGSQQLVISIGGVASVAANLPVQ